MARALAVTRLEANVAHEPSVRISEISFPDLPDSFRWKLDRESLYLTHGSGNGCGGGGGGGGVYYSADAEASVLGWGGHQLLPRCRNRWQWEEACPHLSPGISATHM